jgi:DNA-binding transcriptional MerR regulator
MNGLRSGEVAAAAGVNLQTLRYYERRGLLAEPERSLGGHRLYPAETVTVLKVIKAAQRLGFTLDEIADLLENGRGADAGLRARAQAKLAEIEAKIVDLEVVAGSLRTVVDAGCDDLLTCTGTPCCPIPLSELASRPPGPPPPGPAAGPRARPRGRTPARGRSLRGSARSAANR